MHNDGCINYLYPPTLKALELVESLASRIHTKTGERGVVSHLLAVAVQADSARRIVEAHFSAF